jgi:hypothetical protein
VKWYDRFPKSSIQALTLFPTFEETGFKRTMEQNTPATQSKQKVTMQ